MFKCYLTIFVIICIFEKYNAKRTESDDFDEVSRNILFQCGKEYGVTDKEIDQLIRGRMVDIERVKCFLACSFKKFGFIDENGMFSLDAVFKLTDKYMSEKRDEIVKKQVRDYSTTCQKVNDLPVNDGSLGCDRAKLFYECFVKEVESH